MKSDTLAGERDKSSSSGRGRGADGFQNDTKPPGGAEGDIKNERR